MFKLTKTNPEVKITQDGEYITLYAFREKFDPAHNGMMLYDTGVKLSLPDGQVGVVVAMDDIAYKTTFVFPSGAQIVDHSYTDSIKVTAKSLSTVGKKYKVGDAIAKLYVMPIITQQAIVEEDLYGKETGAE